MFELFLRRNANILWAVVLCSAAIFTLASCKIDSSHKEDVPFDLDSEYIKPNSATEIVEIFDALQIKLKDVRSDDTKLPRIYFECLPDDMHKELPLKKRQEMFILSVLPLILKANEEIKADRKYLLSLTEFGDNFSPHHKSKLEELAKKYKLKTTDINQMLIHIDIVPPSLALAQTCLETGWGSSYAARIKNSLFGMTVSKNVKPYSSLAECTWAYMRNLNYNPAYEKFRALRAEMRKANKPFDSVKLSASLTKYCEYTRSYLQDLKLILSGYNLSDFDQAALANNETSGIKS